MKRLALAAFAVLLATWAQAQDLPVTVIGPVTPGDCAQFSSTTIIQDSGGGCGGGGSPGVSSLHNVDGTLTISPATGAAIASLNLGNANTWTATQTFLEVAIGANNVTSISGNSQVMATASGVLTNGDCVSIDSAGNFIDAGGACTTSGGGGTVASGTHYQLAYYTGTGTTVGGLTLCNNGVYVTNGSGVPSCSTTLPGGLAIGTPVISGGTINSAAIGGTTPAAGAFTTLSATSTVSGAGITALFASPPAIGGTAAAAAVFTTLKTTGAITDKVRTASSATDSISATTDNFVCADNASTGATENLPGSPATGLTFYIQDCSGNAASHSITINPNSGNINGAANFVLSAAYQLARVTYTGSQWNAEIIGTGGGSAGSNASFAHSGTFPTGISAAGGTVMMGLGSTCAITPKNTGNVEVTFSFFAQSTSTTPNIATQQIYYGTGSAPANGQGMTGTVLNVIQERLSIASSTGSFIPASLGFVVTGLAVGTAYWFDLALASGSGTTSLSYVGCWGHEF
jgi:hypothetical protein